MRSHTYEQALTKQGVNWEYVERVSLNDISKVKGLRNQARLVQPIDEELVEKYQLALRDGCEFPPLVLYRPGRGAYVPIDGNQRLEAGTREKHTHWDAYIVKCNDSKVIDRLTWTFNNLVNGKRLSAEECIEHAISYVRKYSVPQKEAAKEWGIPLSTLNNKIRALEVLDVLNRQKVKITPSLDEPKIIVLAPLQSAGEDIIALSGAAVAEGGLNLEETKDLATRVKAASTHEKKVEAIVEYTHSERYQNRKAESKGGKVNLKKTQPREQLPKLIRQINSLFDNNERTALKPVGHEYKKVRNDAAELAEHLCLLFGLGDFRKMGDEAV